MTGAPVVRPAGVPDGGGALPPPRAPAPPQAEPTDPAPEVAAPGAGDATPGPTLPDEPVAWYDRTRAGGAHPDKAQRQARDSQSFWTAAVGVPAVFSVLRLGVEAGGELQTTLLLVANVGPVNLLAGFLTTAARLLSTALVAIFALGAVLGVSVDRLPPGTRRRPLFARWADLAPTWLVVASFLLALVTWPLLYLPLLVPAFVAAFQLTPAQLHDRVAARVLLVAALLGGYAWLLLPTLLDAARQGELLAFALLAVPPVLAVGISGPLPGAVIRPLASVTEVVMLATLVWASLPVISTPVLPLTVTTVGPENGPTEDVRGHVVTTDDVNMVILQERGGVRYVPVDQVRAQVLCPSEEELPRHRLRIHDFHVEDSLLEGLGRRVRPVHRIDAACRAVG